MNPYNESIVFKYDESEDEYIEPDIYPPFIWDYYTIHDVVEYPNIAECYILIDPDGKVMVRKWWNGTVYEDKGGEFDSFVNDNIEKWHGTHMYELDIHW